MPDSSFIRFSKPFIDALKETFQVMLQTEITPHSPKVKSSRKTRGDITALLGMNGQVEKDGVDHDFKGLIGLSWPEDVYVKLAGRMLMEDYTEYCADIADSGAEICNIVMGNAKGSLANDGYKIGMATPSTIRGKDHEIKYPEKTIIIEITLTCDVGEFTLELCYQEV